MTLTLFLKTLHFKYIFLKNHYICVVFLGSFSIALTLNIFYLRLSSHETLLTTKICYD